MTDIVQIELIRACSVIPGSLGGIIAAWFSYKASMHAKEASTASKEVINSTNGMSHTINELTAKSSKAEGVLEEKTRAHNAIEDLEKMRANDAANLIKAKSLVFESNK